MMVGSCAFLDVYVKKVVVAKITLKDKLMNQKHYHQSYLDSYVRSPI